LSGCPRQPESLVDDNTSLFSSTRIRQRFHFT
jgi:hypothetical protein